MSHQISLACRLCGSRSTQVFVDLGTMPLANQNLTPDQVASEVSYPLVVRVCNDCLLVQVAHTVSPQKLFEDYDYFSSYSRTRLEHASRYCALVRERFSIGPQSFVVEVASNDGYLLRNFADATVLGIEPAANVAKAAISIGVPTKVAFFGTRVAAEISASHRKADLMIANNVLAHVPDILDFVGGFSALLSDEGVATFEFPHVLQLIQQVQFDTIYHEHFSYFSLLTAERAMDTAGLRVFDVEQLTTHGGSLRLFVCHSKANHRATARLQEMRDYEYRSGLHQIDGYTGFAARVESKKDDFKRYLESARAAGRKIAAYGAAAKGNTFLNACGLTFREIPIVYDLNKVKQGKLTPGSHLTIAPPSQITVDRPDDLVILPWNLAEEIVASMAVIRDWGGRFVVAIPQLRFL